MTLQYSNAPIKILCFDFRPACAHAPAGKTVAAEDKSSIPPLRLSYMCRQRCHGEVGENTTVHGLETKVGREVTGKIKINAAVDRGELGVLARVFAENHFHPAIHRARCA